MEKKHLIPIRPVQTTPLGTRAMRLSFTSYLIHGTNRPHIVGTRASAGCITMYPEDIEMLFDMVPEKTQVTIINMPVKWASINHQYWIEAHPPHQEAAWLPTPITTESKHLLTRMNIPEKMRPKKTYNSLDSILRGLQAYPQLYIGLLMKRYYEKHILDQFTIHLRNPLSNRSKHHA